MKLGRRTRRPALRTWCVAHTHTHTHTHKPLVFCTVNLRDALTPGETCDGGGGLQGHVICCDGPQACSSSGGVGYSCRMQRSQHNVPSQLAPVQVCLNRTLQVAEGRESASARQLVAGYLKITGKWAQYNFSVSLTKMRSLNDKLFSRKELIKDLILRFVWFSLFFFFFFSL